MSEAIGASIEQKRQHEANSMKLNIIMALAAIMAVIVAVAGIYVSVEVSKHGKLEMLHTTNEYSVAEYRAAE